MHIHLCPTPHHLIYLHPTMTTKLISIAIVGGGIGGLCLAIGLLQHPHLKVTIYEAAPVFSEIGAGVGLGPNAQRALSLISPAAERAFVSQATGNLSPGSEDVWFDFRCGMKDREGEMLGVVRNQTGQRTIHRARLLDGLIKLIPDGVGRFGKRLARLEEQSRCVTMFFDDGTRAKADAVIGADGIHSIVRRELLGMSHPAVRPAFTGSIAYRGLVPMEIAQTATGGFADTARIWCGTEGLVMSYPIEHGETVNVVAARSKVQWLEYSSQTSTDAIRENMLEDYINWGAIPRRLLETMEHPTLWAVSHHPSAPYFNKGNIAMMGDAAHAMSPYQGAGAGQAIEDALTLSAVFGHVQTVDQIAPALAAYDAVRRPRSQKVVNTSREQLDMLTFNDGVVNGDSEMWTQAMIERMDWLWNGDLVKQNKEAVDLF
ncbi:hypothetical protein MW887_000720 [Aspergillus wentii]|nr:hypothetical protein MW887_000720 [Aspergillus wentii]